METSEIYSIADHAVRTVMSRRDRWWDADREDARQEAAFAILLAARRGLAKDRGYYFGAARKGVYWWIRNWLRPERNTVPLAERIDEFIAADTTMSGAMLRGLDSLAPLLVAQRTKGHCFRQQVELEVAYCRLMVEGYTIDEAAGRLGRTRRNTLALRERVLPRLRMIAEGKRPVANKRTPTEKQLANIRPTPEMVARRNAAIRAAKRATRERSPPPTQKVLRSA